jgi:sugar diacid utilization regulator
LSAAATDQAFARDRVGGLRRIHLGMIDAVLAGEGLGRVAELAAAELGGSVRIELPALDISVASSRLAGVRARVAAEVPVHSGDERLGTVALLGEDPGEAREVLELAALAVLTAVTLRDASVTRRRASAALLAELEELDAGEIVARARRLGADLEMGASALCVRPPTGHVERVLATIAQEAPGALAAVREDRVEALLPVGPGGTVEAAEAVARRLVVRLRRGAPAGLAPFERDVSDLMRALRAAQLAADVGEREGLQPSELLKGSWRLLLGVAARDPAPLRETVAETIGPIAARGELLDTLRAYAKHGATLNGTATAVYAHRHTVAKRLERIRELTGHDPQTPAGLAELALGLQSLVVAAAAAEPGHADATGAKRLRVVGERAA